MVRAWVPGFVRRSPPSNLQVCLHKVFASVCDEKGLTLPNASPWPTSGLTRRGGPGAPPAVGLPSWPGDAAHRSPTRRRAACASGWVSASLHLVLLHWARWAHLPAGVGTEWLRDEVLVGLLP